MKKLCLSIMASMIMLVFSACKLPMNFDAPTVEGFESIFCSFNGTECMLLENHVNDFNKNKVWILGTAKITNASFGLIDQQNKLTDSAVYEIVRVEPEKKTIVVADPNGEPLEVECTLALFNVRNTVGTNIVTGSYVVIYGKSSKMDIIEIIEAQNVNDSVQNIILLGKMK